MLSNMHSTTVARLSSALKEHSPHLMHSKESFSFSTNIYLFTSFTFLSRNYIFSFLFRSLSLDSTPFELEIALHDRHSCQTSILHDSTLSSDKRRLRAFFHSGRLATGNGYQERREFTFSDSYIMQRESRDNPSAFKCIQKSSDVHIHTIFLFLLPPLERNFIIFPFILRLLLFGASAFTSSCRESASRYQLPRFSRLISLVEQPLDLMHTHFSLLVHFFETLTASFKAALHKPLWLDCKRRPFVITLCSRIRSVDEESGSLTAPEWLN